MTMTRILSVLLLTLVLAGCTAPLPDPAEPLPEGSTLPTATATASDEPDPVAESPYEPCDEATSHGLGTLYAGEPHLAPTGDYYPSYLPLPSCVFEDTEFSQATAMFVPGTEADFETLEAAIAAEQGAGTANDGHGLATAGELWDAKPVQGIFLFPAGTGTSGTYVAVGFTIP